MHYIKVSPSPIIILKNGLQLKKNGLKNADFFDKKTEFLEEAIIKFLCSFACSFK
jgi:hypothetical protein